MATAYSGGDPSAGPGAHGPSWAAFRGPGVRRPSDGAGSRPHGTRASLSPAALQYLVANRGSARWIVAAQSSNEAAPIQLDTGQPVMAMGGFNGSDPAPTRWPSSQAYIPRGSCASSSPAATGFGGFGQALGFGVDLGVAQLGAPELRAGELSPGPVSTGCTTAPRRS